MSNRLVVQPVDVLRDEVRDDRSMLERREREMGRVGERGADGWIADVCPKPDEAGLGICACTARRGVVSRLTSSAGCDGDEVRIHLAGDGMILGAYRKAWPLGPSSTSW